MTNPDESWYECEKRLTAETRARESVEAELRETVGELESKHAKLVETADKLRFTRVHANACKELSDALQARLAEATALLETIRGRLRYSHADTASDIDALLSRAPAQPAAPEPSADQFTCNVCEVMRDAKETAEAQLVAVRAELDAPGVGCLASLMDRIAAIVTPGGGTGEKT